MKFFLLSFILLLLVADFGGGAACSAGVDLSESHALPPISLESITASYRAGPVLEKQLQEINCRIGSPIFIRVFKQEAELELWVKKGLRYRLYKIYTICDYSGDIGPKLKEGDKQSPEGFYRVTAEMMNPWSNYHLAFNLGFPNEYDMANARTGSNIMVHGRCSSVGCFAMTDFRMDEIYTLADAALRHGQDAFEVHIFPFRLNKSNMQAHATNNWYPFWLNLKEGYDLFESEKIPPAVTVYENKYHFSEGSNQSAISYQVKSEIQ
ncbi:murein L,D-transpeptidase family protein [Desulfopila sp. IMCC35008]|uniref:L,D-transpeptidase family protein n=1 Tax=Desulfopila sp. IMCC35008 TaxID=2653858 RepID=UPI0013D81650|nr:murein L,D-transpeptidase family protein [Desulfopila sp. IMCC35008]